jgi:PAS domain-containing protein
MVGPVAGPSHQRPIELILLRELARRLSTPVTLYDAGGRLAYLNRAAEVLFAVDYEELGEITLAEAVAIIRPTDTHGVPIPVEHMPTGIALGQQVAQQANMWVHDQNGKAHRVANTSIPLRGQGGGALGAMSIWWKVEDGDQAPREGPPTTRRISGTA